MILVKKAVFLCFPCFYVTQQLLPLTQRLIIKSGPHSTVGERGLTTQGQKHKDPNKIKNNSGPNTTSGVNDLTGQEAEKQNKIMKCTHTTVLYRSSQVEKYG